MVVGMLLTWSRINTINTTPFPNFDPTHLSMHTRKFMQIENFERNNVSKSCHVAIAGMPRSSTPSASRMLLKLMLKNRSSNRERPKWPNRSLGRNTVWPGNAVSDLGCLGFLCGRIVVLKTLANIKHLIFFRYHRYREKAIYINCRSKEFSDHLLVIDSKRPPKEATADICTSQ